MSDIIEVPEFKRFRETKVAKSFDPWLPITAKVQIRSGKHAGNRGVVLHQTTRHRYFMMIYIPERDMDVLCSRKEVLQ